MKKKITTTLVIGFVSLISGLILAGIGFFSGGFNQLVHLSTPEEIHKTYDNIDSIDLQTGSHSFEIIESKDQFFHVTYRNSKNSLSSIIQATEKDGVLSLSSQERNTSIRGIMQFLGEQASYRYLDIYSVVIEVPKGKNLKKINSQSRSWGNPIYLKNLSIEEVNIDSPITLDQVTIHKGDINLQGFYSSVYNSTLKNVNITGSGYQIDLKNSQLEKVSILGYNSLISQNLTFIGENHFTPHQEHPLSVTNLDISDQSLQDLNLTINNSLDLKLLSESLGYSYDQEEWPEELTEDSETMSYVKEKAKHIGIFTKDKYEKLPVKTNGDKHSLIVEKKDSKNKLTIEAINGTINLVTPK